MQVTKMFDASIKQLFLMLKNLLGGCRVAELSTTKVPVLTEADDKAKLEQVLAQGLQQGF